MTTCKHCFYKTKSIKSCFTLQLNWRSQNGENNDYGHNHRFNTKDQAAATILSREIDGEVDVAIVGWATRGITSFGTCLSLRFAELRITATKIGDGRRTSLEKLYVAIGPGHFIRETVRKSKWATTARVACGRLYRGTLYFRTNVTVRCVDQAFHCWSTEGKNEKTCKIFHLNVFFQAPSCFQFQRGQR